MIKTRPHVWKGILFLLIFTIVFFLRLASIGLPQTWINNVSEKFSTPIFTFDIERVSVSLRRRELDIGRIQVYPRGHISEAVFELLDTSVRLWPKRNEHPLSWIRSIRVRRAVVPSSVAHLAHTQSSSEAPAVGPLPDWGPLHFTCDQVSVLGTSARQVSATLKNEAGRLILDPVSINFSTDISRPENLKGRLAFTFSPFLFTAQATGKVNAVRANPIFETFDLADTASEIARFTFNEVPPALDFTLVYDPTNAKREITLHIDSGYCQYNGVTVSKASGILTVSGSNGWNRVKIDPVMLVRPEGQANGFIDIDTDASLLTFSADSTIDPLHLLRIIRVASKSLSLPFAFDNPTRIVASGSYDLKKHPKRSLIEGKLTAARITTFGVDFQSCEMDAVITDSEWRVAHATAKVFGGDYEGGAIFTPSPTNTAHVVMQSIGSFRGLLHAGWSALLGDASEKSMGTLDLDYSLTGPILEESDAFLDALSGTASVALDEVQLYRIPLFAGLTTILAENIPGVDFVLAQDALTTSIRLTNGVVTLPAMKIIGNVFSASGGGTIDFDGNVDLKMKVHLLNRETWIGQSLYYVLFPLSKIFELQATGTLEHPKWSSATLSSRKSK